MKKYSILLALSFGLTTLFVGCTNSVDKYTGVEQVTIEEDVNKGAEVQEEEKLEVDIESSGDILSDFVNTPGLEFTPVVKGRIPDNIQYHWIIDNPFNKDRDPFEMFYIEDAGGSLEIINDGEPVLFSIFAQVSYINPPKKSIPQYIDIILKVEDETTLEVLGESKLLIENRSGEYKVIKEKMTEKDKEDEKLNTLKRVVYEKLEDEDKIKLDEDYLKASVERVVLTKDSGIILDERYINEEVYKIDFIGKDTGTMPNNKVVFVNDGFLDIIGYGYLD